MSRYIDADKLKEKLEVISIDAITLYQMGFNAGLHRAEAEIELLPTADAVEVVRCKDCKYWHSPEGNDAHYCYLDYGLQGIVPEEDYCSYGERREQ